MKIFDCHVNVLPDWARLARGPEDLRGETASIYRCYAHPDSEAINRQADADTIVQRMDEAGVAASICFSYQWLDAQRCIDANRNTSEALAAYPGRLFGLAVVQPRAADAPEHLAACLAQPGFIGLKMKPKWGGFSLADTELLGPLCDVLIARKGILLTHISQNFHASAGDNLSDLLVLLKNFPALKVVAAHLGGFAGVYEMFEPVAKHFENLFIDTSLPANLAWLPHLMRLGNPSRYVFGTDFPYVQFGDMLSRFGTEVPLTDREIQMVCEENPRRLLAHTSAAPAFE